MIDARPAALTGALGLSVNDLAEIGGFSGRFARDLVRGKRPFPADVCAALKALDDDVGVITDELIADVQEGTGAIFVFRSNDELRQLFPAWPGRGKARGGFVGPYRIAALAAADHLADGGIDVDLVFWPAK